MIGALLMGTRGRALPGGSNLGPLACRSQPCAWHLAGRTTLPWHYGVSRPPGVPRLRGTNRHGRALRLGRCPDLRPDAACPAQAPGDRVGPPPGAYHPPGPLPPLPAKVTAANLLPYICRLALSDARQHWRVGVAVALLICSKVAGLQGPLMFKRAVDHLAGGTTASAVRAASIALLLSNGARVLSNLTREAQTPIITPISQKATRAIAYNALYHVLGLDLQFHLNRKTGALAKAMDRGSRAIGVVFRALAFTAVPTAVELVAVCVILARNFSPIIAGLVLVTFAAYAAWTVKLAKLTTQVKRSVKNVENAITAKIIDALLNFESVALYGNEDGEVEAYDRSLKQLQRMTVWMESVSAVLSGGQSLILTAGMAVALLTTVNSSAGVTAGDLVMVQGLLFQLWSPLSHLGWFYRDVRQSLVDLEDLVVLLQTQNPVADGPQELACPEVAAPPALPGLGSSLAPPAVDRPPIGRGLGVELRDVTYTYPGTAKPVLRGVSLQAQPGESIAIVGPSGSGKSTVLRLLTRMFDPGEGAILADGQDLRGLSKRSLRAAVGVIPQDTVLFNDSLRSNVLYGQPGAGGAALEAAAGAARLGPVLRRLPSGWDTVVGERGLKLSGGEKQRVAIARAFLRQPRLIICDEATSALDSATEQSIVRSLDDLIKGRTAILVAHRLSTVQGCDRIYVMQDGRVVEAGSHKKLLAAGGLYAEMWQLQEAEKTIFGSVDDPLLSPGQGVPELDTWRDGWMEGWRQGLKDGVAKTTLGGIPAASNGLSHPSSAVTP